MKAAQFGIKNDHSQHEQSIGQQETASKPQKPKPKPKSRNAPVFGREDIEKMFDDLLEIRYADGSASTEEQAMQIAEFMAKHPHLLHRKHLERFLQCTAGKTEAHNFVVASATEEWLRGLQFAIDKDRHELMCALLYSIVDFNADGDLRGVWARVECVFGNRGMRIPKKPNKHARATLYKISQAHTARHHTGSRKKISAEEAEKAKLARKGRGGAKKRGVKGKKQK